MSEQLPAPLLVMLDELERPDLERIALVLRAKLRAAPSRREEREHELGPLHAMLKHAGLLDDPRPRLPRQQYDRDRPLDAPRGTTLASRYGSWFKACQAAVSLNLAGGTKGAARPWSSKHRGGTRGPTFTRKEVIDAVLQCAAAVGRIPSTNLYYDWSARERRRARERGSRLPRLPAQASVERHFKKWSHVRAAVESALSYEGSAPSFLARGSL